MNQTAERSATKAFAITPHDTNRLTQPTRFLAVGVAGTVTVDMLETGTSIQFTLPSGIHPLRVTKVYATGTAATGLVGLV
jgi:hypothetical protein